MVDHKRKRLAALVTRRRQLIDMHTAESNRLDPCLCHADVKTFVTSMTTAIENQIDEIDALIDETITQHDQWKMLYNAFLKVKGVGKETARMMITQMPELGTLNRRQVAALVGLAPMTQQSGNSSKSRHISGGRKHPRGALYMASLSAARWNPVLKEYYQRLTSSDKPKRSALIAIARKLLLHLNAIAKKIIAQNHQPQLD